MAHSRRAKGRSKRFIAVGASLTLVASMIPAAASAAPNADVGYPEFQGSDNPIPDVGAYTTDSMMQAIFDRDLAAGAGENSDKDFWMDEMLARTGTEGEAGDNNQWLFTRGRVAFMKTHEPQTLGFDGEFAYWEAKGSNPAFTVDVILDGEEIALEEDTAARKQTPSYWRSVHEDSANSLRIVQTKFITNANVLVTNLEVHNDANSDAQLELRASSPYTAMQEDNELIGGVIAHNNVTTVYPRLSGDDFAVESDGLVRNLDVAAGEAATAKVQMGWVTEEIEDSASEYEHYRSLDAAQAYTEHVTAYNQWWADNIVYLDTPEDNIDKTLFYRWWLLRFNYLDANMPGNTYQFPTAIEGVFGYNNAIDLTVGMFIDDLKYFRDPIYSYGGWVSTGETSAGSRFVDNPGNPAHWGASHTQYISEAAWRSYQLHGGPEGIVENLARYAAGDAQGQLDSYDSNDNGLLETNWNAWTGNDSDAVSFDYFGRTNERAESAYVYSGALVAADAYRLLGQDEKAADMEAVAEKVKDGVLEYLWDPEDKLIKHRDLETGELIPWKEINNYYPFSVGLIPREGDDDYDDDYIEALRLYADDEQYPIFPFYTANQADDADRGGGGSNNFSIINSTVTFRMITKVLREYPNEYIDSEWYKKLLYWNAYAHYMNDGDNRLPDANEFWAEGSHDPQAIDYRSWIHHTILGTTNFTVIEDVMGLRPRSDNKIELHPIDIEWPHFMANNIRYRDSDLTIVWDAPGDAERPYGDAVPEGYSLFIDGELAFTVSDLTNVVYDPASGEVTIEDDTVNDVTDAEVLTANNASVQAPQEVQFAADDRVVDLFAKAGQNISSPGTELKNLALGAEASASFSADNFEPSSAVNGSTINEPFWGTAGSPNQEDHLEIDFGETLLVDNARVFFYATASSATRDGYAEPVTFRIEYHDGDGWKPVENASPTPTYPRANLNEVAFKAVQTSKLRVVVNHADGFRTGIKEFQAFSTGEQPTPRENAAPQVIAFEDQDFNRPGQARLIASIKDDGLPGGEVTSTWSMVSGPEEGTATFADPDAATTVARFSAEGEYVLRVEASDGELTTSRELTVQVETADEGKMNVAPWATPSASFTAGHNDVNAVNNGRGENSGGSQTEIWGTWTGDEPATRWLQYTWDSPLRISESEIMFWSDADPGLGSNVSIPESWSMEYLDPDTEEWVEIPNPSEYGTERTGTNVTEFDPVITSAVRATFNAYPNEEGRYAAVAVSEWQIFADAPEAIEEVHVRTLIGEQPTMPDTVEAVYSDNSRAAIPVSWETISSDQLASEGSFTVVGLVDGSPLQAKATVWVRPNDAVTLNVIDPVEIETTVGVPPALPRAVGVLYNDGSRESLAVEWDDVDAEAYGAEGTFSVEGTVDGFDSPRAVANVTVTPAVDDEDPDPDPEPGDPDPDPDPSDPDPSDPEPDPSDPDPDPGDPDPTDPPGDGNDSDGSDGDDGSDDSAGSDGDDGSQDGDGSEGTDKAPAQDLPRTGSTVGPIIAIGLVMILIGALIAVRVRKRRDI